MNNTLARIRGMARLTAASSSGNPPIGPASPVDDEEGLI